MVERIEDQKEQRVYKVIFLNQGKVYELYARKVSQGNFYGFIELETLMFGERSTLLVDPSEEKLQGEFAGVKRSLIPIHAVIRIDEVEREGISKIRGSGQMGDNVTAFPGPILPSGGKPRD
jgi:hypothetical protein